QPRPVKDTRVRVPSLRDASPPRLIDGQGRLDRCRRWRRAVEWHPIDRLQHGKPDLSVLGVLIGVLLEQHDRHDFAVMLTAVDPVAYRFDQYDDGFDAAIGRRLEDPLDASISAVEALHVDSPFFLPRESYVLHCRDQRFRLTDRNEVFANYLVGVVEADEAVLERQRIDGPSAACL